MTKEEEIRLYGTEEQKKLWLKEYGFNKATITKERSGLPYEIVVRGTTYEEWHKRYEPFVTIVYEFEFIAKNNEKIGCSLSVNVSISDDPKEIRRNDGIEGIEEDEKEKEKAINSTRDFIKKNKDILLDFFNGKIDDNNDLFDSLKY